MHIGLDLLFLSGRAGGVETYVAELVPAMLQADAELRLTGFVPRGLATPGWLAGVELVTAGVPGPARPAMLAAQSTRLGVLARRHRIDLLHSPANFAPVLRGTPLVVTVHDLLHRREPQLVPPLTRTMVRGFVDGAARRARRILTVSEASATDIVTFLGRSRQDIDVTPPAARPVRAPRPGRVPAGPRPEVLSVGNARPHKNLELLLDALARTDESQRPRLVLPGSGLDQALGARISALGLQGDVQLPGWVSDEDLERLYARASAYVCPSLFEGFGLPVLEAMLRDVPVACSDIPVLHEVAGDAAIYFDPRSAQGALDALTSLLSDPARAGELARRGRARADEFSWDRTATATLASYRRALGR